MPIFINDLPKFANSHMLVFVKIASLNKTKAIACKTRSILYYNFSCKPAIARCRFNMINNSALTGRFTVRLEHIVFDFGLPE